MLTASRGYKSSLLGGTSFASLFNGGVINVFSGARTPLAENPVPANCTLLGQILPLGMDSGLQFVQNGPCMTSPLGAQWTLSVLTPGTAVWFRLQSSTDSGTASPTDPRIDGDVGTVPGVSDLILANVALTAGMSIPIDLFYFTVGPNITP